MTGDRTNAVSRAYGAAEGDTGHIQHPVQHKPARPLGPGATAQPSAREARLAEEVLDRHRRRGRAAARRRVRVGGARDRGASRGDRQLQRLTVGCGLAERVLTKT
jgi:hypothetical protein